jgi:hypothetical protein
VNENGWWRRGYNKESYSTYKEPMVTDIVRSARLKWAGHVRINDNEPPKKIITSNLGGQRGRGHPKLRWIDGVEWRKRQEGLGVETGSQRHRIGMDGEIS